MPNLEIERNARILCPNCGAPNPAIQQVKKKTNFLLVLLHLVLLMMQEFEGAQPVLCVDNDEAGQNFVKAVGLPARLPAPGFKD